MLVTNKIKSTPQKTQKFGWLITGGRNAHLKKRIGICPTILSRFYKGYDTYGIPGVVEITKYGERNN